MDTGCCIKEIIGNKVYLKPTTVHIAKNGIFINIKGGLYAVNHLEMDLNGVYIDSSRTDIGDIFVGKCPDCGEYTIFGSCGNPNCPKKRK